MLATTDPQKVRDTIRSRTQHLSFHLLNEKELEDHVRWVAEDAGIELTEDAIEAVVRQGGGSARDTLSALEVVAAGGGVAPEAMPLDEFVESIIEHDPGRALAAVAASAHLGRDARSITEAILAHLRDCFLSIMAPELVQLPEHRAEVVSQQAHRLGAAAAVRSMEGLGDILVEMRHAPDPRVLLEVALVKLTSDAVGGDVAALLSRIERLERQVAQGGGAANTGAIPRPVPTDPATGRAMLGGRARQAAATATPAPAPAVAPVAAPADPTPAAPVRPAAARPASAAVPASAPSAPPSAPPASPPSATSSGGVTDPAAAFEGVVRPGLKGMTKALFVVAQTKGMRDGALVLGFPSKVHADKASKYQDEIDRALSAAVGSPSRVIIEGDSAPTSGSSARDVAPDPIDEVVDPSEFVDGPAQATTSHLDRIAATFPGSDLVIEGD